MKERWTIERARGYSEGGSRYSLFLDGEEVVLFLPSVINAGAAEALRNFANFIESAEKNRS
jgi:hypothetical protein